MIHWGEAMARFKNIRNIYEFVLLLGSSGATAIRVSLLVHVSVVDMFLFLKFRDEIFVLLNFFGGLLEVLITILDHFKVAVR